MISRVATGRIHDAHVDKVPPSDYYKRLPEPPKKFNSVRGLLRNDIKYHGVIIYNDNAAYPEYLLTYSHPL